MRNLVVVAACSAIALAVGSSCADGGGSGPATTVASIGPGSGGTSAGGSTTTDDPDDDDDSTTNIPPLTTTTTGTTDPGSTDESSGSTGDVEPPDLADGTWVFENVSNTPALSLSATRAALEDGTEVVSWSESQAGAIGVLNVLAATNQDGAWMTTALTSFMDGQNTFPDLAPGGSVALLAWSGVITDPDDYDVYLSIADGDLWSTNRNISGTFDGGEATNELRPVVMRHPGGKVIVAYLSEIPAPVMGVSDPPTVNVVEFDIDGTPASQIELIRPTQADCSRLDGVMSTDGVAHILLQCRDDDGSALMHGTDRSGTWDADALAGITSGLLTASISAAPDGSVHAVWVQNEVCGDDTCGDVFYAGTTDDVFGTPVNVTNSANLEERMPAVGVDRWGRVLIFSQARVDNVVDIYLTVAEDGVTFGPSERITPNDNDDDFQSPTGVMFDAGGSPSFAFEYLFSGSRPLNIDIEIARFIPN